MTKEDLLNELKVYVEHVYFINDLLNVYFSLFESLEKYRDDMSRSPCFFTITQYSLSKTMFLELSKMYSQSKNEKNLKKLLNVVKANQKLFDGDLYNYYSGKKENIKDFLQSTENFYTQNDRLIANLKARRDKVYAHSDKIYFDGKINFNKDYPINIDELNCLICFMNGTINSLSEALGGTFYYDFYTINSKDLLNLFSNI